MRNRRRERKPSLLKTFLNAEQKAELAKRLNSPPEDGGIWSGLKIATEIVATMTGREKVCPQRGETISSS